MVKSSSCLYAFRTFCVSINFRVWLSIIVQGLAFSESGLFNTIDNTSYRLFSKAIGLIRHDWPNRPFIWKVSNSRPNVFQIVFERFENTPNIVDLKSWKDSQKSFNATINFQQILKTT